MDRSAQGPPLTIYPLRSINPVLSSVGQPHRLQAYDFELPEAQIAQAPAERRDESRLLVLDRQSGRLEDRLFRELPDLLAENDLLIVNNTRVFPARLRGRRVPGGGRAELLLVRELEPGTWEALAKPGRRLQEGSRMEFGDGSLRAEVTGILEDGRRVVTFDDAESFWEAVERVGEPPLPPYIRRSSGAEPLDTERYQTVYARERGAVAAPTAGLHFTPELLDAVRARGTATAELTLHVGYGTFEPVRVEDLREHRVAPEMFTVSAETVAAISRVRQSTGRVIAVGTTTTRALESAVVDNGHVEARSGVASLTITPGYAFRVVDAMITNFHLPKSSLLVLVTTFGGYEPVMEAYRHAVSHGYRFYSYGDAMLIL
jgi:S-adenosylmethionine:tRNA ribosyltransferase-isomerase